LRAGGARLRGALLVGAARQPHEAFCFQEQGNGGRTQARAGRGELFADVVDRQVLLAQRHHPLAHWIGLGRGSRALGRGQEERPGGASAKLMAQHAEAAGGVAEAARCLGRGEAFDEVGAQGFVLAVGGVAWVQEIARLWCG